MKQSKKITATLLLVLVFCFISVGLGYILIRLGIQEPYQEFRTKELAIIPMLDALNENVEHTLPPLPPDSVLVKRLSSGIDSPYSGHGRWLYLYIRTQTSPEDVSKYYRSFLFAEGWSISQSNQFMDGYMSGTSCIEIDLPSQYTDVYVLTIWHDFRSQSFSPPVPNALSMRFYEVEGSRFASCHN